jgi:excisionase family DNA binding protein
MADDRDATWERLIPSSIAESWETFSPSAMPESPLARAGLLLSIPEAAAALRISRSSIYRLFDSGELSWVRICGRRRVSAAEINRFIAAHTEVA